MFAYAAPGRPSTLGAGYGLRPGTPPPLAQATAYGPGPFHSSPLRPSAGPGSPLRPSASLRFAALPRVLASLREAPLPPHRPAPGSAASAARHSKAPGLRPPPPPRAPGSRAFALRHRQGFRAGRGPSAARQGHLRFDLLILQMYMGCGRSAAP